jgi:uncharacterized protein
MEPSISQDRETNIGHISEGYAAFGRGDRETVTRLFHPDMVWHALRLGELSGDKVGRDAVFAFFGKTMELTEGTFSVTPEEILASDTTGAVVCRSRARRNGRELDDKQGSDQARGGVVPARLAGDSPHAHGAHLRQDRRA